MSAKLRSGVRFAGSSQMCLRLARRVKRKASRTPSTAPIIASKIVFLSNDRLPLPAIRKPEYAIATVQRIMRLIIGPTSWYTKILTDSFVRGGLWHDFRPIVAMILGHQDFPQDKGNDPCNPLHTRGACLARNRAARKYPRHFNRVWERRKLCDRISRL